MTIRPVTANDFESIALIHKEVYSKKHLTSFFPLQLLQKYYKSIWEKNRFAFIAINDAGTVAGFVIGGDKLNEPIKDFIKTYKLPLALVLLKHSRFIFLRLFERLRKTVTKKEGSVFFRLLSIAVKNNVQATACAKQLLQAFEQQLRGHHITQYGLSVKKTNTQAIHFYEKNNFEIEYETGTLRFYYKKLE